MSEAQVYVDALREGNYSKALELTTFINQKYEPMKNVLGADELVQLGAYELSQTDINEKDILLINFLYNYIQYHQSLAYGEIGYSLTTFLALISVVLSIKMDTDFKTILDLTSISDVTQFASFLQDTSDFSRLVERNMNQPGWMLVMTIAMTELELLEYIAAMSGRVFENFHRSVQQFQLRLQAQAVNFSCSLVQTVENVRVIKETVADFKLRLQSKLAQEGIKVTKEEEVVSPEEPTCKQQKLINRYQAVHVLWQELQEKELFDHNDRELIFGVLEICALNEADWYERDFNQKVTDILSGGLKPLYRTFFSKEAAYKLEIDGIAQNLFFRA
ncbi:hypothetical protein Lnau_2233 [Legionella nautarum]|uniref:VPS9 domain-containing protein n=1 Tax=Legionella nautarum TaxID=45070 RepID=A0A0W0WN53_9GAMM|nr:hypothetical protein [Legionella nautarum]KTD33756.1 hypothetical protein Lnau_2233 [Legionella nautarum]